MSATNRGSERNPQDFYTTPSTAVLPVVNELIDIWMEATRGSASPPHWLDAGAGSGNITGAIRCATATGRITAVELGGDGVEAMLPGPTLFDHLAHETSEKPPSATSHQLTSRLMEAGATEVHITDYLARPWDADIVVSNPPFALAEEFVLHTYREVRPRLMAFLTRLDYLGSRGRMAWLEQHPPSVRVLVPRVPFGGGTKSDSNDYAWMIWAPCDLPGRMGIAPSTSFADVLAERRPLDWYEWRAPR